MFYYITAATRSVIQFAEAERFVSSENNHGFVSFLVCLHSKADHGCQTKRMIAHRDVNCSWEYFMINFK